MKRRLIVTALPMIVIPLVSLSLSSLGFGMVVSEALTLRPYPDAVEQVWQALAFADGRSALMPIGSELHPPRYAPIHPLFLAGWIKLCGTWQSIYWWAPVALTIGYVFLYFALPAMDIDRLTAAVTLGVIATSVLLIRISQSLLQESTVFLLLSADIWLGCRDDRWNKGRLVISGILAGALLCIRPTYALWPVCRILYMLWKTDGENLIARLRCLILRKWPYVGGILLIVGLEVLYIHSLGGRWDTQLYSHWQNTDRLFSWKNFSTRSSWTHYPMMTSWEQVGSSLLGIYYGMNALGWPFNSMILIGSVVGLKSLIERKSFVIVLLMFAVLQAVAHAFYRFYAPRFMIAVYPWLIISGVAGWKLIIGKILEKQSFGIRTLAVSIIFLALVVPVTMSQSRQRLSKVYKRVSTDKQVTAIRSDLQSFSNCREIIRHHQGVFYVDAMDTIAARIFLDLVDRPHPVYQLSERDNWWEVWMEGHYCELPYTTRFKQGNFGRTEPRRPYEIFLVKNGSINTEQLTQDLQHGGAVILYPAWRHQKFGAAMDEMKIKYDCVDRTPTGSTWKLYEVTDNKKP